jgi:hypothetical protein
MLGFMYVLDTLEVARASVRESKLTTPDIFQLSTLDTYLTILPPYAAAQQAEEDITLLLKVLLHNSFWFHQSLFIHKKTIKLAKYWWRD